MVVSRQGLDPFTYGVEGMVCKCVGLKLYCHILLPSPVGFGIKNFVIRQ